MSYHQCPPISHKYWKQYFCRRLIWKCWLPSRQSLLDHISIGWEQTHAWVWELSYSGTTQESQGSLWIMFFLFESKAHIKITEEMLNSNEHHLRSNRNTFLKISSKLHFQYKCTYRNICKQLLEPLFVTDFWICCWAQTKSPLLVGVL